MKFQVRTGDAARQRTACAIVPVYTDGKLGQAARLLDRAAKGLIADALKNRDLKGEVGETLMLTHTAGLAARRILLVGLGNQAKADRRAFRRATRAAYAAVAKTRHADAVNFLTTEPIADLDAYRRARIAVEAWHEASYRFTALKSRAENDVALKNISLAVGDDEAGDARRAIRHGEAIGRAVSLTRELGNLPPNVCTPGYLAGQARRLARRHPRLRVRVLGLQQMRQLRMGALLAVTQGSKEPPRFIEMRYQGAGTDARPYVFVGKGITFDTGGICIKPPAAMDEMKYDMCGAATVLGLMQAVAELGLRVNVVGLVPACENMPSGTATRPGDIVRTMSGQTVEVLNTDAEGRLILCDALTYAKRFRPRALIDIATLTGACVVALGRVRSGLLSNSDELAGALLDAGQAADDRVWRLPLDEEYGEQLRSNFADMANVGGREAGTITAAMYLQKFVEDAEWAHLDIAGTAWVVGAQKGGTGRPVPLLVEYLLGR